MKRRYWLDTGPLLDWLLLKYVADIKSTSIDRVALDQPMAETIQYLKDIQTRRAFSRFLDRFKPFNTTPGVVVEVHKLARTLEGTGRGQVNLRFFWCNVAVPEFRKLGIEEEFAKLIEMDLDGMIARGPVDEALVCLAKRNPGTEILTGDDDCIIGVVQTRSVAFGCMTFSPS